MTLFYVPTKPEKNTTFFLYYIAKIDRNIENIYQKLEKNIAKFF